MSLGTISVELNLDSGTFTGAMVRATGAVTKFGHAASVTQARVQSLGGTADNVGARLHRLIQTMGLFSGAMQTIHRATTEWMLGILKTNGEIERMTTLLSGLSNAGTATDKLAEAKQNVAWLFDFATKAPFSVNALTDAFVKLKSAGIETVEAHMKGLVNAVAAFGGSDAQLHRAAISMQQMVGKGVISMEELRQQLGEAVPTAMKMMATAMGLTMKELVDKVSKGTVEAKSALARMVGQMERINYGAAEAMMDTWSGLVKQIETKWTLMQVTVGEAGFLDAAKGAIVELIALLNAPVTARFLTEVGQLLGQFVGFVRNGIVVLYEFRATIERLGVVMLSVWGAGKLVAIASGMGTIFSAVRNLTTGMIAFNAAMNGAAITSTILNGKLVTTAAVATAGSSALNRAALGFAALGRGIALALGPLSVAAWALFEVARALNVFGSAYDDAKARIADGELAQTTKDLAKYRGVYEEHTNRIATLTTRLDVVRKNGVKSVTISLEAELAKEVALRKSALQSIVASQVEMDARQGEVRARAMTTEINAAGIKNATLFKQETERYEAELEAAGKNDEKKLEAGRKFLESVTKNYDAQLTTIQNAIKRTEQAMQFTEGADSAAASILLADLAEKEKTLTEARAAQIKLLKSQNVFLEDSTTKLSKYEQHLATLNNQLGSLNGQLDGTGSRLGRVNAMLAQGLLGDVSAEEIEKIRAAAKEIDRLNDALKGGKAASKDYENAMTSLSRSLDQVNEKAADLAFSLNNPGTDQASSGYLAMVKSTGEAMKNLTVGTKEYAEAQQKVAEILAKFQSNESLTYITGLREKTQQIKQSLMTEREAKIAQYEWDVEQVLKKAELWKVEASLRLKAEEELNANLKALREAHMRDMETPTEQLFRSWMDKTKAMQEASANWIRGFADALTEFIMTGKMDFKKFADSIIRDIIRIQVQANIATVGSKLLNGLLDGMFKSSSSGGSFTLDTVPTAPMHTGGIAGRDARMGYESFSGGLWANAPKYHNGMVGGRKLSSGEIPAIIKKEEGVFTPAQMKALGGGANIVLNIINQTSQPVNAKQSQPRMDGERMVLDVVLQAANTPGPFRDGLKGAMA